MSNPFGIFHLFSKVPYFSAEYDDCGKYVDWWFYHLECFFHRYQTTEHQKLSVATSYLNGKAWMWYTQWYKEMGWRQFYTGHTATWEDFVRDFKGCFHPLEPRAYTPDKLTMDLKGPQGSMEGAAHHTFSIPEPKLQPSPDVPAEVYPVEVGKSDFVESEQFKCELNIPINMNPVTENAEEIAPMVKEVDVEDDTDELVNADCSYDLSPEAHCTRILLGDTLNVRSGREVNHEASESTGVGIDIKDLSAEPQSLLEMESSKSEVIFVPIQFRVSSDLLSCKDRLASDADFVKSIANPTVHCSALLRTQGVCQNAHVKPTSYFLPAKLPNEYLNGVNMLHSNRDLHYAIEFGQIAFFSDPRNRSDIGTMGTRELEVPFGVWCPGEPPWPPDITRNLRYLNLVKVMIESEYLPLHIPMEMFPKHKPLKVIRQPLVIKCVELLQLIAEDKEAYRKYLWTLWLWITVPIDLCALDDLATDLVKMRYDISWLVAKRDSRLTLEDDLDSESGGRGSLVERLLVSIIWLWSQVKYFWDVALSNLGYTDDDRLRKLQEHRAELENEKSEFTLGRPKISPIVNVLLKLVDKGQYCKNEHLSETVAAATSFLLLLEPALVCPFAATHFSMASELMTVTHQLKTTMTSVAYIGRLLFLSALSDSSLKSDDLEGSAITLDLSLISLSSALLIRDAPLLVTGYCGTLIPQRDIQYIINAFLTVSALSPEDRACPIDALKDTLQTLSGQHSDALENPNPKVKRQFLYFVLLDPDGHLMIDNETMNALKDVKRVFSDTGDSLADYAMTGHEGGESVTTLNREIGITCAILSKLDRGERIEMATFDNLFYDGTYYDTSYREHVLRGLQPTGQDLQRTLMEQLKGFHSFDQHLDITLAALAEASAPYGIESFDSVLKPLWKGIRSHRGKVLAVFLKTIRFIIPLRDAWLQATFAGPIENFLQQMLHNTIIWFPSFISEQSIHWGSFYIGVFS